MDRLATTFERLRRAGRKALIPFVMAGDPDLETTAALVTTLADNGADVVEVGIPFSDPLADGPIIQRASSRSLSRGTTPQAVLRVLGRLSGQLDVPLLVLSYWNPILQYRESTGTTLRQRQADGTSGAAFLTAAAQALVSGVIVPDLPPEEAGAFRSAAHQRHVATIFLAAPTSPPERLRQIARASQGFIYYVSLTGTTGVRERLPTEWLHGVRQLKLVTTKPVCVGFGVSTPEQAARIAQVADGVIVGSALLKRLEPVLDEPRALAARARAFVRQLREAI